MDAPAPIKPILEENDSINLNNLNNKNEFSNNGYIITIGLLNDYLIIFCKYENDNSCFQLKSTYENLVERIPNFKMISNISDLLTLFKQLFETNRYGIKVEGNILKIIIKLKNMLGNDEEHELILKKVDLDNKQTMEIMEEKIKNLEKKLLTFTAEKDELLNKINILTEENKSIKDEITLIKMKLNINQNPTNTSKSDIVTSNNNIINNNLNNNINYSLNNFHSKIFNQISEIKFIFDEINKIGNNIRGINLLFRASENGDKMENFDNKCNNKENELIIIKTTKGNIFGGFTKTGWNNKNKDIFDSNAFMFSYNLKKIYNIVNPQYALHRQSGDGRLSFGSNSYVFLLGNNFLNRNSSTTDKMIDYRGESTEREINGGEKNFKVLELEVFQIYF